MSTAETNRIRILVVDDDPEVLALARDILGIEGFAVLEAPGGEDALRVAKEHAGPIHLLLTDVVMPGMNGPELADRLRATRPETKVLFMSAFTSELAASYGVLSGDPLITKPFTVMGLAKKVRETLGYQSPFPRPGAPERRA
jgi:two-component system cell cycle sensor histidine kinase/response regulator CckA